MGKERVLPRSPTEWMFITRSPTIKFLRYQELFFSPSSLPSTSPRHSVPTLDGSNPDSDLSSLFVKSTTPEILASIHWASSHPIPKNSPACKPKSLTMDDSP